MLQRIASCSMAVLGALSLSLAQGDLGTTPSSTPVYTPPTSSYSTPSSSSSTSAPRTGAYGVVMNLNAASDNTVADYTMRPTLIGSQQFISGWTLGGAMNSGAFSFQGAGMNWFGAVLGGGDPDDVRLGVGTENFGGGLLLSMAKTSTDPVGSAVDATRTTLATDGYGIFGDLKLGGSDIYGELGLLTDFQGLPGTGPFTAGYSNPPVGPTISNNFFHILLGWKKDASTEGTHALNGELAFNLSTKDEGGAALSGQIIDVILNFNHGYILKQSSGFSVFAGSNSSIRFVDQNMTLPAPAVGPDSRFINVDIAPNLAFQKTLGKGFEAFLGTTVTVSFEKGEAATILGVGAAGVEDSWSLFTTNADGTVGLRWVYENFAVEGSVADALLTSGPNVIGGQAPGLLTQAGVSVGF